LEYGKGDQFNQMFDVMSVPSFDCPFRESDRFRFKKKLSGTILNGYEQPEGVLWIASRRNWEKDVDLTSEGSEDAGVCIFYLFRLFNGSRRAIRHLMSFTIMVKLVYIIDCMVTSILFKMFAHNSISEHRMR
jgi:hypothetical protein